MPIMTKRELESYSKAGTIAQEVLSSIKTVFAYNGSKYEHSRYTKHLHKAKQTGIRKGMINGLLIGFFRFILYCIYAVGFYRGAQLVHQHKANIGDIFVIFFTIIIAIFSFGQATTNLQFFGEAIGAMKYLCQILDTSLTSVKSQQQKNDKETITAYDGLKLDQLKGDIEFDNVCFSYPRRSEMNVLSNLSFKIKFGDTVAIIGHNGCGK
ncbi:unnamed protein product, partial [Didymodactylos carnosus]